MKIKFITILTIFILSIQVFLPNKSMANLSPKATIPPTKVTLTKDNTENNSILKLFISFCVGVLDRVQGKNNQPFVSSKNVKTFSKTIETFDDSQNEKTEFGINLLNLITLILEKLGY